MAALFQDNHELLQFARRFLTERTDSLRHDFQVCTENATAAFPAILYTFATIDLLGALLGGDARAAKGTTDRAKAYMRRFMHYSDDQCTLLMDLFRHKIVHLAQPRAVAAFKNARTSWHYWHDDGAHHLKLAPIDPPAVDPVTSTLTVIIDQEFQISIRHLVDDVIDSVQAPGGYLHSLSSDADLQDRFSKAIGDIYNG